MKHKLVEHIKKDIPFPNEKEVEEVLSLFTVKEFQKGDYIMQPCSPSRDVIFIAQGSVRIIFYKKSGEEVTARMRQENAIIANIFTDEDKERFPIGAQCMEDAILLVASREEFRKLLQSNLTLNIIIRNHYAEQIPVIAKRHYLFLTGTAKERYRYILENNPSLLQKFPLRFIASIIGITPTQLSRVRHKV